MTRLLPLAGSALLAFAPAAAQTCGPQWLPGDGFPGIDGTVHAIATWDPDGPGPKTSLWTFGGQFTYAGTIPARRIALFNPETSEWSTIPLGTGTTPIYALAPSPDGDLIVGGEFYIVAGVPSPLSNIARWDGSQWLALGTGINGQVRALTMMPNGDLIAGGAFTMAGGGPASYIARWGGQAWSPLGNGVSSTVHALLVLPNGELIAGGSFYYAGGILTYKIARWDGAAWSPMGGGLSEGYVFGLAQTPNGDIIAAGDFTGVIGGGPVYGVARWNGTSWSAMGAGIGTNAITSAVTVSPHGDLLVAGRFTWAGPPVYGVARWDGSSWAVLGEGPNGVLSLNALPNGDLLAGGLFHGAAGGAQAVARWDGTAWSPISPGTDKPVEDMVTLAPGQVVAAGQFNRIGGSPAKYVAQWNGAGWAPLGAGVNARVRTLAPTSNGLVAGGDFTFAGGFVANRVARWNGSWWSTLGGGVLGGSHVRLVGASTDGDSAVAAGDFTVAGGYLVDGLAFWNGATWLPLSGIPSAGITALSVLPGGEPIAAYNNAIHRWTGSTWTTLAHMGGTVYVLRELPGGDLIAGGVFTLSGGGPSNYMAKWNGSSWSAFPGGAPVPIPVVKLALREQGLLAVASSANVFLWNGSEWSGASALNALVHGVGLAPSGEVVAGGAFTTAAGAPSWHVARWTATNTPWIALQPQGQVAQVGQSVIFSSTPATRYTDLAAEWALETAPASGVYATLSNGPIPGAAPATAAIAQPGSGAAPAATSLTISGVSAALHNRRVRVTISNSCGGVTSNSALLTVAGCYPDCNTDGQLTVADFGCFQTKFVAADPYADCNTDGTLTVQDFGCFQTAFVSGCP